MEYLGHIVTSEGVKLDPWKVSAIRNYSRPTNVKEIRSFIGLASYYRRHVSNFTAIALSLIKLTRKNEKFEWGDEQEKVFGELRERLCAEPLLSYLDFS